MKSLLIYKKKSPESLREKYKKELTKKYTNSKWKSGIN